jgi:hypothetical protein
VKHLTARIGIAALSAPLRSRRGTGCEVRTTDPFGASHRLRRLVTLFRHASASIPWHIYSCPCYRRPTYDPENIMQWYPLGRLNSCNICSSYPISATVLSFFQNVAQDPPPPCRALYIDSRACRQQHFCKVRGSSRINAYISVYLGIAIRGSATMSRVKTRGNLGEQKPPSPGKLP